MIGTYVVMIILCETTAVDCHQPGCWGMCEIKWGCASFESRCREPTRETRRLGARKEILKTLKFNECSRELGLVAKKKKVRFISYKCLKRDTTRGSDYVC